MFMQIDSISAGTAPRRIRPSGRRTLGPSDFSALAGEGLETDPLSPTLFRNKGKTRLRPAEEVGNGHGSQGSGPFEEPIHEESVAGDGPLAGGDPLGGGGDGGIPQGGGSPSGDPSGPGGGGPLGGGPPGNGPSGGPSATPVNPPQNDANELVHSMITAFRQIAQPASSPPPSKQKTKLRDPTPYDGTNPKVLRGFLTLVTLHINDRPDAFRTHRSRVLFILSYLTGAPLRWFQPDLLNAGQDGHTAPEWTRN